MYLLYIHFQDCYWLLSRWAVPYITHPFPMTHIKECLFHVLMCMGRNIKLSISSIDLKGQNAVESYVQHNNELVGCIKLIKLWHAIGHTVHLVVILHDLSDAFFLSKTAEPTISTDFITSGSQFSMTTTVLAEMKMLSLFFITNVTQNISSVCHTPQNIFCL